MIHVGPAGWSYDDWRGLVYPRASGSNFRPLRHLARFVSCVEINSSFYGPPTASHVQRWLADVGEVPEFRFTAKLQEVFTHGKSDQGGDDAVAHEAAAQRWLEGIEPLRASGKLKAVLVQFPVSFRDGSVERDRLESIESRFGHLPLVLEVRHRSWFAPEPLAFIAALGYSMAHIDLPQARDHPPQNAPCVGPIGYVRLHGRNSAAWFDPEAGRDRRYDYLYSQRELKGFVELAQRLASAVEETYVITNNHFSGKAVTNALEMMSMIEPTRTPRAPAELVRAYPRLRDTVLVSGQQDLFS